jgi:NitT/TauT family transport system substrate-binding protein
VALEVDGAIYIQDDPFFLVGRGDPSAFRLADLARLRFASVSEVPTPWLCLQQDLRDAGVDPDRLERVTDRTMGDSLEALRKGELDVAQLFEPYVSMALATGAGQILYAASARGAPGPRTSRAPCRLARAALPAADRVHDLSRHPREHRPQPYGVYRDGARGPPHGGLAPGTRCRRARRRGCAVLSKSCERAPAERAGLWATRPEVSREGFARLATSLLSGGFVSRMYSYDECVDQSLY